MHAFTYNSAKLLQKKINRPREYNTYSNQRKLITENYCRLQQIKEGCQEGKEGGGS